MRKGDKMDVLEEAKKLMKKAGCEKAFAIYGLELNDIAEVKNCDENGESLELEKDISELVPTIEQKLVFDSEKPIECPLNSSMNKYLEFSLKNRSITLCNLNAEECEKIEEEMRPLLEKYNWTIKKR
ncbi:MAG: hypothetical protein ACFFAE_18605 [Candidatus Hodarchaeota archaeon]